MSQLAIVKKVYDDGRTKQAFKDATDIHKILAKAQKAGGIAHVLKYDKAVYGEFDGYDLQEAYGLIERANSIFDDLPSEVRKEFANDALAFAKYASAPENIDRLAELIPAIAEPGRFMPNPVRRADEPEVIPGPVVPVVAVTAPVEAGPGVTPVVPGDPGGGASGGVT